MLGEIYEYRRLWANHTDGVKDILREMTVVFIHNINTGEGVGTQNIGQSRSVISRILKGEVMHSKIETETANIQLAMNHIDRILSELDVSCRYLMEQDDLIKTTHRILMTGVNDCITKPGRFSVLPRRTVHSGLVHEYPYFKTEKCAEDAVQRLIDQSNIKLDYIMNRIVDEKEKMAMLFKCSAGIFIDFLSLHPHGDGNGRVGRMVLFYLLRSVSPFPTCIAATRADYITAVVSARQSGQPCDLAAMIIEGNWFGWKQLNNKQT